MSHNTYIVSFIFGTVSSCCPRSVFSLTGDWAAVREVALCSREPR